MRKRYLVLVILAIPIGLFAVFRTQSGNYVNRIYDMADEWGEASCDQLTAVMRGDEPVMPPMPEYTVPFDLFYPWGDYKPDSEGYPPIVYQRAWSAIHTKWAGCWRGADEARAQAMIDLGVDILLGEVGSDTSIQSWPFELRYEIAVRAQDIVLNATPDAYDAAAVAHAIRSGRLDREDVIQRENLDLEPLDSTTMLAFAAATLYAQQPEAWSDLVRDMPEGDKIARYIEVLASSYEVQQILYQGDTGGESELEEVWNSVVRAKDAFEDTEGGLDDKAIKALIEFSTPDADENTREIQRNAVRFLLDPDPERSEQHFNNMMSAVMEGLSN
jgi:hypothetical protein